MHVVLVEPEIPQNAGNVARTCAVTGTSLHLVHPLGFSPADRYLKRAGLDYWPLVKVSHHADLASALEVFASRPFYLITTRAPRLYSQVDFPPDCYLIFGKETAGLPCWLLDAYPDRTLRIPMLPGVRSLNLSNAVAVVLYEALRQQGYPGLG
ncbi:MAG: tRNA (cytidine(34)-2'-O)-methyltransferase [Thermoanaerobacterales bacterium]|nr:tRNA (cytidine(34)-2'-O)-methyltransferase [Thermoanaerobacterales bacterium]